MIMACLSLPACLAEDKFREMSWCVNNLRYRKGEMDSIQLKCELMDLEEELKAGTKYLGIRGG